MAHQHNSEQNVELGVKVMRLFKPKLGFSSAVFDYSDHLGEINSQLSLPEGFGHIYLGQAFSIFVRVTNTTRYDLKDVMINAKLQTPSGSMSELRQPRSNRKPITGHQPDTALMINRFNSQETKDFILETTVNDSGCHVLNVSVRFLSPMATETQTMNKYYRFQVASPFETSTSVFRKGKDTFVEVGLRNVTNKAVTMESVEFEPTSLPGIISQVEQFKETVSGVEEQILKFCDFALTDEEILNVNDSRSFLFKLSHNKILDKQKSLVLGKVVVKWKTGMLEGGNWTSAPVLSQAHMVSDVSFEITNLPKPELLKKNEIFNCTLNVSNNTQVTKTGRLVQEISDESPLILVGKSTFNTTLPALSTIDIPLSLISLEPGIQQIKDMTFIDAVTQKKFPSGPIADVWIK
eukprot:TRINITY_DN773980_c0_g1_i1.p1 TRINITY_DN773980_c0_g1~~TRINITY_DN773980_c0_g1_i1.p1  ORF type:complete len:407 (+),score=81.66 TRINITY_DN773980_c0_g1_i1:113-1333(+)